MADLLSFLQQYGNGILILFLILFGIAALLNYSLWLFAKGRFKGAVNAPKDKNLNFVIANAAVKLIDDFRHLLALILVIVFSSILVYAVYISDGNVATLKESLQAVMATLGGLVGSIIGYYFGEARKKVTPGPTEITPGPSIQKPEEGGASGITPVKSPPTK